MKRAPLGPGNQGSMSFAAMGSVLALSLGFLYVFQTSQQTQQAVDNAMNSRASEMGQASNLSNLALIRSLMSDRKTPDGKGFEPGVFPVNYFANSWDLQKNLSFNLRNVDSMANRIRVRSFSPKDASIEAVAPVFAQTKSQLDMMNDVQTLEVVALNRSPEFPYYVASIDVKAKRKVAMSKPNGSAKEIVSYGRIDLSAPVPQEMRLKIRGEHETTFTENFGTAAKPLKPGKYVFRLEGSGVVHHGEISVNGDKNVVGLDNKGNITHKANNIRAFTVIGDTQPIPFVDKNSSNQDHVNKNGCSLDVENDVNPGAAPGAVNVVAKLIGVDGAEANKITIRQPVIVGRSMDLADNSGTPACQEMCPADEYGKIYENDATFSAGLDKALRPGRRGNDIFEGEKTGEANSKHGRGIVCGNYELVAQELKNRAGMDPSALQRSNPAYYKQLLGEVMPLKQYVAYMAPSCKREVVGFRNGCGCFEEKTLITMADGSTKLASEIRSGDMVLNPKTGKGQMIRKVIAGPERWPLLEVKASGKSVTVTGEHPFLTKEGLKPAFKLSEGDVLIEGSEESVVEAVITEERKEGDKAPEVWNFELLGSSDPDEHYVLANGVMTGDLYLQQKLGGQSAAERLIVSE